MNIIKAISDNVSKGIDLADQAITDKDKLNELKYTLETIKVQALFTGKGSSITKITICGLIAFVVVVVILKWLITGDLSGARELIPLITPLIGMLVGSYGAGKTLQKKFAAENLTNGDDNDRERYVRQSMPKPVRRTKKRTERPARPTGAHG